MRYRFVLRSLEGASNRELERVSMILVPLSALGLAFGSIALIFNEHLTLGTSGLAMLFATLWFDRQVSKELKTRDWCEDLHRKMRYQDSD